MCCDFFCYYYLVDLGKLHGYQIFLDEKSKMNNIIMIIAIVIALTWLATIPQIMRHKTSDGYQLRFTRKSTKVNSHFS